MTGALRREERRAKTRGGAERSSLLLDNGAEKRNVSTTDRAGWNMMCEDKGKAGVLYRGRFFLCHSWGMCLPVVMAEAKKVEDFVPKRSLFRKTLDFSGR